MAEGYEWLSEVLEFENHIGLGLFNGSLRYQSSYLEKYRNGSLNRVDNDNKIRLKVVDENYII